VCAAFGNKKELFKRALETREDLGRVIERAMRAWPT
jgi:hypothetical protein